MFELDPINPSGTLQSSGIRVSICRVSQRRHDEGIGVRSGQRNIEPHPARGGICVEERGTAAGLTVNIPATIGKILECTDPESRNPRASRVIASALATGNQVDGVSFVESAFRGIINDNTDRLADLQRTFGEAASGSRKIHTGAVGCRGWVRAIRTSLRKVAVSQVYRPGKSQLVIWGGAIQSVENRRIITAHKAPGSKPDASVVSVLPAVGIDRISRGIGGYLRSIGYSSKHGACAGGTRQEDTRIRSEMTSHNC